MAGEPPLRPDQFERDRRHLSLPELGVEGQRRLLEAHVLLIGAGGLGCPLAQYLAAAGVGHLGLVDPDVVDASNLQRQILYSTADVGRPKVEVATERVAALNPDVEVTTYPVQLRSENALEIFEPYDIIIDGTDNFPTRYLSNDACVLLGKPNVYGSIFRFEGQATVFDAAAQMREFTGRIDTISGRKMIVDNRKGDKVSFVKADETVVEGEKSSWGDIKKKDWVNVSWKMVDKPRKAYKIVVLPPKEDDE